MRARRDAEPVAAVWWIAAGLAWPYLRRIGEVVMPEAARLKGATSAGGLGDTLTSLIPHAGASK